MDRLTVHRVRRALLTAALLVVATLARAQGVPATPEAGIVRMNNDPANPPPQGGAALGNMTYHGGPVQHVQKVFTIFWDTGSSFPAGYQTTINQFVQDLSSSPYYAIASQYSDSTSNIDSDVAYGGTWLDATNAFPATALGYSDLLAEVNRAKTANGWVSDANSYFQVYTPAGITSTFSGICGLHYFANPAIGQILFPQPGCFPGSPYPNGSAVDAAINVSAHEIMETVTDPLGNAWYFVNTAGEIGDLCNFNFGGRASDGSNVTLNGHHYVIQQEWSNAVSGCTLSAPVVNITANGESGPVMLPPGSPLLLAIAANGGPAGFANPSHLYIGVSSPFGLFWLTSTGFTSTPAPLYSGPLPNFGPTTLFNIPNVSVLPSGGYAWFIVLVNGTSGLLSDVVQTIVP